MKFTYQREAFVSIMAELPPLILAHYAEVSVEEKGDEVDVAWQKYLDFEMAKMLHVLTVRADGKLVGYHICIVRHHLRHADRLCAWSDVFFILPEYRRGPAGIKLFTENEKMLAKLGVKKIFTSTKIHIDLQKLMKRLKYKATEQVWTKWVG